MSAGAPGASVPSPGVRKMRAPSAVAMFSACTAGTAVASPLHPLARMAASFIVSNMSRLLLLHAPSVPRETEMPARTMSRTRAKPDASFKLLTGLWAIAAPEEATSSSSSSVTSTMWASTVRSFSSPMSRA